MSRRFQNYVPAGVIPAALMPFTPDLEIDEPALRRHMLDIARTDGISAICVNGVSQEVTALTLEEQKRTLDIMMDVVGDTVPLMHGVFAHGARDAAGIARQADAGGASCLLVFPPAVFTRGSELRPEMTIDHYKAIADVTDLPLIVFQYEMSSGQGHSLETLLRLADEVPTVKAIKDRSNDPVLHERNIRVLQGLSRPVNVLTTHSAWLMSSLVLGCNGILSGSGSVIAPLHVALWNAIQRNDLKTARELNDRIYPLAKCFYGAPVLDMHTRMKVALQLLDKLPNDEVRLPWVKLRKEEVLQVGEALRAAGLI